MRTARTIGLIAAGGAVIGGAIAAWARFVEPRRLAITRLDFSDGRSDAITLAFVTDTHIGPHTKAAAMQPLIAALQAEQPDVLMFGGDFICESPRYLAELEAPLKAMTATAKTSSWGIWGNHDLANMRERVAPVLKDCGVTMLQNESVQLVPGLSLVGIDDVLLGQADVAASFAKVPDGDRTICLWHEPDVAERVLPYSPMLMLSGHTHGGQIRLPAIGSLATPALGKRYVAGEYRIGDMPLYVSRGNGMYRPPVRLNCSPELVIIRA